MHGPVVLEQSVSLHAFSCAVVLVPYDIAVAFRHKVFNSNKPRNGHLAARSVLPLTALTDRLEMFSLPADGCNVYCY